MASITKRLSGQLEALRVKASEEAAAERKALETRLWSDPANNITGWRDALARAGSLKDGDEARAAYQLAVRSGDVQLQKAIYLNSGQWRALIGGWELPVSWGDVPSDWREAQAALTDHDAGAGSAMGRVATDMLLSPVAPAELAGVSDYQLNELAASVED